MKKEIAIRFMADVNQQSTNALISVVEAKLREGYDHFKIIMSSNGGSVHHGISVYNYLKGISAEVETCNFGAVDSIATVIYCAGTNRTCVPNARFLIHSVGWSAPKDMHFQEKQLKEITKSLAIDRENIAKIIAEGCNKTQKEIEGIMLEGETLNSQEAKDYGLVTHVSKNILPKGMEVIGIG